MNVVKSFEKRKREKQLKYERKLLRELSIDQLKKSVLVHFNKMRLGVGSLEDGIEEACFDVAIEAFLSGGEYSRFALYGETEKMVKKRADQDYRHFIDTLYNFWLYWDYEQHKILEEETYKACQHFVDYWWRMGYQKGERRYKLRLH